MAQEVILNADETFLKVSEVMNSFKKETGHYPTRSDVLRYLPPPGYVLINLEEAFNRVKKGAAMDKAASLSVDERPDDPHLPEFHKALHEGYKGSFYEWHKEQFGSFWCTGVAA